MDKNYEKILSKKNKLLDKRKEIDENIDSVDVEIEEYENNSVVKVFRDKKISLYEFLDIVNNKKNEKETNYANKNEFKNESAQYENVPSSEFREYEREFEQNFEAESNFDENNNYND